MSTDRSAAWKKTYRPAAAVIAYGATIAVLGLIAVQGVGDVIERYREVANLTELLGQLERRQAGRPGVAAPAAPSGAPFLEGATQAVAGAALLQRVSAAVAEAKGTIQSSQVELEKGKSAEGTTVLTASCEIPEPMLQGFLYDIESGMPFLFVESLVAQTPQGAGAENAPLRVLIEVSGQWRREP
jgi:general secretion pathway protein M